MNCVGYFIPAPFISFCRCWEENKRGRIPAREPPKHDYDFVEVLRASHRTARRWAGTFGYSLLTQERSLTHNILAVL